MPERKIKNSNIYGLCKKYRRKAVTTKQINLLQSVTDMDYLHEIYQDDEARVFMADFICELFACDNTLRTTESEASRRRRMRDITQVYQKLDINTNSDGTPVEDLGASAARLNGSTDHMREANPKFAIDPDKKYKSNYTIRDYMPSPNFNQDAIIDAIDHERLKAKIKRLH